MKYDGFIKKSRTLDFQVVVALFAMAETNFHLVENYLGGNAGLVLFGVCAVNVVLRFVTTGPVGDK